MITADGNLRVYMLSVGQGDTTVVVTPEGRVIVVDVMRPAKVVRLLQDLGHDVGDPIAHLVITHPHSDHFGGGNRPAADFRIAQATVAPFWHAFGMGPPTNQRLIGRFFDDQTNVTFLSGNSDGAMTAPSGSAHPEVDPNAPVIETLGPTNGLIRVLEDAHVFNANHLSITLRFRWRSFRMIIRRRRADGETGRSSIASG